MGERTSIGVALVVGLLAAGLLTLGNTSPSCVPVEPQAPVCEEAADCSWCMYLTAPASPGDCVCPSCDLSVPMLSSVCRANRAAYDRQCGHLDCPIILCEEFPPVTCVANECVVSPAFCGDQDIIGRYDACRAADDEASCSANGGSWGPVGLYPEPVCQCPTGQGDCPCDGPDDCLSSCIAPMGPDMWACEDAVGHCSPVSLTVGCFCLFLEDGQPQGICAD